MFQWDTPDGEFHKRYCFCDASASREGVWISCRAYMTIERSIYIIYIYIYIIFISCIHDNRAFHCWHYLSRQTYRSGSCTTHIHVNTFAPQIAKIVIFLPFLTVQKAVRGPAIAPRPWQHHRSILRRPKRWMSQWRAASRGYLERCIDEFRFCHPDAFVLILWLTIYLCWFYYWLTYNLKYDTWLNLPPIATLIGGKWERDVLLDLQPAMRQEGWVVCSVQSTGFETLFVC